MTYNQAEVDVCGQCADMGLIPAPQLTDFAAWPVSGVRTRQPLPLQSAAVSQRLESHVHILRRDALYAVDGLLVPIPN